MRPVIVLAEQIAAAGVDALAAVGDVVDAVGADREQLRSHLADANALVVRSATDVDADLIAAAPKLSVIGRAGVGVDNIDLAAATAAGVLVVNAPTSNIVSAAEHAFALLLSQARNIPAADAQLRGGTWDRKGHVGVELDGKTLGILGLGKIGTLIADRAHAFGMNVVAYDPYVTRKRAKSLGVKPVRTTDELFAAADFITVHLPKTKETAGLLDADAFAKMRPGVRIVNASRGGIIDEVALAEAVRSGVVAGAALDVFETEPIEDSPLFGLPQVVVTPHLGASTAEAQARAGTDVADAVAAALRGELVLAAVNVDFGRGVDDDVAAYVPLAEHLGRVLGALGGSVPSRVVLSANGELEGADTTALGLATMKGLLAAGSDEPISYVNAAAVAEGRGLVVESTTDASAGEYVASLDLVGEVDGREIAVAGTVGRRGPMLISVRGLEIELPVHHHLLLVRNVDVPGVIGRIATYIGELDINIDDMVVGRSVETGAPAMMGLGLSRGMAEAEVAGLRALEGVTGAEYVGIS